MGTPKDKTTSAFELELLNNELGCFPNLDILNLRRIFLMITKIFFSDKENFKTYLEDTAHKFDYTYSDYILDPEGKNKSIIDITADYNYLDDAAKLEYLGSTQNPKIIISVGDISLSDIGTIANKTRMLEDNSGFMMGLNASTTITFSSYAQTLGDCAMMSQLCAAHFTGLTEQLCYLLRLKKYSPLKISTPRAINPTENKKLFRSDFIIQINWEAAWRTRIESARLRKLAIELMPH
jgi:hypothetical protein